MRDATIRHELMGVQGQVDKLGQASNVQTDALSEIIVQIRALFNLINDSWILSVIFKLGAGKLVAEMKRINEKDSAQRRAAYDLAAQKQQAELQAKAEAEIQQKKQDQLNHKVTKRERQLKKMEKKSS